MKDDKENKEQQQSKTEANNRVETPQPPQRKLPMNESEANRDGEALQGEGKTADRGPSAEGGKQASDRKAETPSADDQEPPTTTTNRRSY